MSLVVELSKDFGIFNTDTPVRGNPRRINAGITSHTYTISAYNKVMQVILCLFTIDNSVSDRSAWEVHGLDFDRPPVHIPLYLSQLTSVKSWA